MGLPGRDEATSRASTAPGTSCPQLRKMSDAAAIEKVSYSSSDARQHRRRKGMRRPRKYATEEERREAARQTYRKYYNAHREAINARRAQRYKNIRATITAGQKET